MAEKQANESEFFFFCGKLPPETFTVISFEGTDEISEPYLFNVLLRADSDSIAAADILNKQSTLYIHREGEYYPYSGIAIDFRFIGKDYDYASYEITLAPRLWLLQFNKQSRIFQNKKVTQIVKDVLETAGLSGYAKINVDLAKLPELEYVVQYQESDLNFISRLLEDNGIWYQFSENPILREELDGTVGNEQLHITDKPATFDFVATTSDLSFRALSGFTEQDDDGEQESVSSLQCVHQMVPANIVVRDYNDRTPEVDLTGQKAVSGGTVGTVYDYGTSHRNATDASRLAEIRANRTAIGSTRYEGSGNCRGFRAGKRFTLADHFNDSYNGVYILLRVAHYGAHPLSGGQSNAVTYTNDFKGIAATMGAQFKPQARAFRPTMSGVMSSQIEANGSDYASIDDNGSYKIRLPFDRSQTANSSGSSPIRLAQPYAGQNYGIHFPSHEGTEMLWACVDGDPSRPVGLATIPNANTKSPVTSTNKQQNVIRTAGGNEMVMDDTDGKQKITIKSNSGHTVLQDDENKLIKIISKDQNALLIDDKNKLVSWNADTHKITMCYDSDKGITIKTGGKHLIKIDDTNKIITIKTNGGHQIDMDDSGKKIILKDGQGKNTVTLDGNGGLILESEGKIEITAKQDLVIKAANIKMTANAAIEAKATSDIKLKGANLEAKADSNAKIEGGMNLDLKAGMQCNVKGTMLACAGDSTAEFKGGMMTTIKGTMVMIN